jgi:hypothetical protein
MRLKIFFSLIFIWMTCIPVSAEYYQYTDKDGVLRFTDELSDVPESQRPSVTTHMSVNKDTDSVLDKNPPIQEKTMEAQEAPEVQGADLEAPFEQEIEDNTKAQSIENQEQDAVDESGAEELTSESVEDQEVMENEGQAETQGLEEEQVESEDQTQTQDQAETQEEIVSDEQAEQAPAAENWRTKARDKQKEIDGRKMELNQRYKAIEQEKAQLGKPPADDASPAEKNAYYEKSTKMNEKIAQYQKDYMGLEKEVKTFNEQASKRMRKRVD